MSRAAAGSMHCPERAGRLAGLGLSPIRAIQNGAPEGAISLGLGEPGWDMPLSGRRALEAFATEEGPCSYGANAGIAALRAAIAAREAVSEDDVLVTDGSEEAVFSLISAYAGPGDGVLVPDPGYLAYPALARLAGACPCPYALGSDFSLDPERFAEALAAAPSAKIAIVNSPSNPTGASASPDALKDVASLCADRNILIISDEVYRELYLGSPPPGMRAAASAAGAACAATSSVSKAWGAPGLRIGWAAGPASILEPAQLVHNYAVTSVSRPAQAAALALILDSDRVLKAARQELAERWDVLACCLEPLIGRRPEPPAGSFYYWLKIGKEDSMSFCIRARDRAGVILIPGSAFGKQGEGYARLSFGGSPEQIREGLSRLSRIWP